MALALAGAALSVADYLGWRADNRRMLSVAAESGLVGMQPDLAHRLGHETVTARAAATLAWRLLDLEVDRQWLSELPADEREAQAGRGLERLRLAGELAAEALARQPASWRAASEGGRAGTTSTPCR